MRIIAMTFALTMAGFCMASSASESKAIYHGETGRTAEDTVSCVAKKWQGRAVVLAVTDVSNGRRITVSQSGKPVATLNAITTDSLTNVDVVSDKWSKEAADPFVEDVRGCI